MHKSFRRFDSTSSPVPPFASSKTYPRSWSYFRAAVFLIYSYATLAPAGPVWGLRFIAYVPLWFRVSLVGLAAVLLLPSVQRVFNTSLKENFGITKVGPLPFIRSILLACVAFAIFQVVPVLVGAPFSIAQSLKPTGFYWSWLTMIQPSSSSPYHVISAMCGAVFVFLWAMYIQKVSTGLLQLVFGCLGLFAGATQVFFGPSDKSSFAILTSATFLFCLYFYLYDRASTFLYVLSYLLALAGHVVAILYLPAFLLGLAYRNRSSVTWFNSMFTWRAVFARAIAPSLVLSAIICVFVFPSFLTTSLGGTSLRFSILSPYHMGEVLNALALTAAPIIVILITLFLYNRKEVVWSCPIVIVFGVAALLPFLFFLLVSPNLSRPSGPSSYVLLFPPLLFFASIVMTHSTVRDYIPSWVSPALIFGGLSTVAMLAVYVSPRAVDIRLQDIGYYIDRSHYSNTNLASGGVRPDPEFAQILAARGSSDAANGDYQEAIRCLEEATHLDSSNALYAQNLASIYLLVGQVDNAARTLLPFRNRPWQYKIGRTDQLALANTMGRLSQYYLRTGSTSDALAWGLDAARMDPKNPAHLYTVADCYLKANQPRLALEVLERVSVDSLRTEMMTDMAVAAYSVFGPDSALAYLKKAKVIAHHDSGIDSLIEIMGRTVAKRHGSMTAK